MQDYFNDFQNMVRSDRIGEIIDKHAINRENNNEKPTRGMTDVMAVLDAIYSAVPSSYPALIKLASVFNSLNPKRMALVVHVLRGGTFTQYAIDRGVSKAAVGQTWKTIVKRCPLLEKIKRGRGL